jgi:excisionase family DNA binding protein
LAQTKEERPAYMTAAEVAEHYRLPLQTIYGWRYKGTGPKAVKLGRHLRYRRSDVEKWADEQAAPRW